MNNKRKMEKKKKKEICVVILIWWVRCDQRSVEEELLGVIGKAGERCATGNECGG
jgi:hypothetical protein